MDEDDAAGGEAGIEEGEGGRCGVIQIGVKVDEGEGLITDTICSVGEIAGMEEDVVIS